MKTCSICKEEFTGFGHNPEPILPYEHRCCDICNGEIVVPIRIFGINAASSLAALRRYGFELKLKTVAEARRR